MNKSNSTVQCTNITSVKETEREREREREREDQLLHGHTIKRASNNYSKHQAITATPKHKERDRQQVEEPKCEGMHCQDSQWMHTCALMVPCIEPLCVCYSLGVENTFQPVTLS